MDATQESYVLGVNDARQVDNWSDAACAVMLPRIRSEAPEL